MPSRVDSALSDLNVWYKYINLKNCIYLSIIKKMFIILKPGLRLGVKLL